MPAPIRLDITANGLYKLYGRSSYSSLPTPQVQVSGTWMAQLVFAWQATPHGGDMDGQPTLTNIPYKVQGDYSTIFQAGVPVSFNGIYEFNTGGLPLWVTITNLQAGGSVSLLTIPDAVPTPAPNQVLLSNGIILDSIPPEYDETYEIVQAWEDAGQTAGTMPQNF